MTENELTDVRFTDFFRRYTKTWIHAVATAGLTAFGTLTFVNRWFAVLAIGSYVIPPVVLYARASNIAEPDIEQTEPSKPKPSAASDSRSSSESQVDATAERNAAGTTDTSTSQHRAIKPSSETLSDSDFGPRSQRDGQSTSEAVSTETQADSDDGGTIDGRPEGQEADSDASKHEPAIRWSVVDTPTDSALSDAAVTAKTACAVGEGGVVLTGAEGEWTVALEDGPAAQSNDLHGVSAAGDDVVWVAGDSGALGRIETDTGRHVDYSAPKDITDNWTGIAVGVSANDETVLVINGSGEVLRGRYRDGKLEWGSTVTPGSGSSLSGIDLYSSSGGFCCDTNDGVFETTDGGESFDIVGVDGADGTLMDIAAGGAGECLVGADDGVVHRYDGMSWTPQRVGKGTLAAIAQQGEYTVTCGEAGIYERTALIEDWVQYATDVEGSLFGVGAAAGRVVSVGTEGTVVERSVGPSDPN